MSPNIRLWGLRTLVLAALLGGAAWVVDRTEWVEQPAVDAPGRRQPFDATASARQFLERLGRVTRRVQDLEQFPPAGSTLVLTAEHWRLLPGIDDRLRAWVESGGHLVGDHTLTLGSAPGWIGVKRAPRRGNDSGDCRVLAQAESLPPAWDDPRGFVVCGATNSSLASAAPPQWALHSETWGTEVVRIARGSGRVTLFAGNFGFGIQRLPDAAPGAYPWPGLAGPGFWRGDQAAWFAALVDAPPGGEVWFLDRVERTALPAWLARETGAALLLAALALAGLLWRASARLGPLAADAPPRRRALAAQIAGSAAFLQQTDPQALHAAARRALDEAARLHIPGWRRLGPRAAAAALARHTGLPAAALTDALADDRPPARRDTDLAGLELARRALLHTDRPTRRP